jgi:hypothetical protein
MAEMNGFWQRSMAARAGATPESGHCCGVALVLKLRGEGAHDFVLRPGDMERRQALHGETARDILPIDREIKRKFRLRGRIRK